MLDTLFLEKTATLEVGVYWWQLPPRSLLSFDDLELVAVSVRTHEVKDTVICVIYIPSNTPINYHLSIYTY